MLDLEFYIYGIFPMIIGLLILLKSFQITSRKKTGLNWILLVLLFSSTLLAEYILGFITFKNAWPTYLPHILIGINLILLVVQILTAKTHKRKNNTL